MALFPQPPGVGMYRVALLAVANCMYSSITGPIDVMAVASAQNLSNPLPPAEPLFTTRIVGSGREEIRAFNGMRISIDTPLSSAEIYDIVIVPVIFGDLAPLLDDEEIIGWLRRQGQMGACLCSACAGSFLIAQTGLLDDLSATTHWRLADDFAARFPSVRLKREKMLVDAGACITAGGVTAYLDLALYLTARFGSPELAALLAKILLIDPTRRLQTPYHCASFTTSHGDPAILVIQEALAADPARSWSIGELAAMAILGERTLLRRFRKATGDSPLEYVQRLRIELARQRLEATTESVADITTQVGYEDISSFRKLFKRVTGLSPASYRKKFSPLMPGR